MAKSTTTSNEPATEPITAANCPEKPSHRLRLNQTCPTCGELVPGHGYYTTEQYERYFAGPQAPYVPNMSVDEIQLWAEYAALTPARDAAIDDIQNAQRGRASVSGTSVDAHGNTVHDDNAPTRAYRSDVAVTAAKKRLEDVKAEETRLLGEINRLGAIRGAKARRAMYEESFPPAPAGIVDRIRGAISGS